MKNLKMSNHPLTAIQNSIVKVSTRLNPSQKARTSNRASALQENLQLKRELLETSQTLHLHICRTWSRKRIKIQKTNSQKCFLVYQSPSSQIPIKSEKRKSIRKRQLRLVMTKTSQKVLMKKRTKRRIRQSQEHKRTRTRKRPLLLNSRQTQAGATINAKGFRKRPA